MNCAGLLSGVIWGPLKDSLSPIHLPGACHVAWNSTIQVTLLGRAQRTPARMQGNFLLSIIPHVSEELASVGGEGL